MPNRLASRLLSLPAALCAACLVASASAATALECSEWPAYQTFMNGFVQTDGRVIDYSTPTQQTTSEGLSYSLFFALVANDRGNFERLLAWTASNLANGRFTPQNMQLPAWQWGKRPDGSFGVLDPGSAADADLWLAYDLLQAGRLWHEPTYSALGQALAQQIAAHELVELPGLGPMLLPGPHGFTSAGVSRLNPSYLPLPVLRGMAQSLPGGPWNRLPQSAYQMIKATAVRGFAPDWVAYRIKPDSSGNSGQFEVDPKFGDLGSYDAIRTYLWAGLSASSDPLARPWLDLLLGMRTVVAQTGFPPEHVATSTGAHSGEGPLSYWAALGPYFQALGDEHDLGLARLHLAVLDAPAPAGSTIGRAPVYYDRVLGLFSSGYLEGRYRFGEDGRLVPSWSSSCNSVQ